jgi:nucleoside-diphosphate-sugar epimerase
MAERAHDDTAARDETAEQATREPSAADDAESVRALAGRAVLVTGATGFLGTHLVRALVSAGARVHALRRSPGATTRLPCEGVTWHEGDLTDAESLRAAARACAPEVVFNLAAYGTTYDQKDDERALRVNVDGAWNLWRALEGAECRLVHAGTCGEYGAARGQVTEEHVCRPTWFYPATKNAGVVLLSTLASQRGREVVTLRPFGPYGAADYSNRVVPSVILSLIRGEEVRVTAGEQLRDYAHVDDHVRAFLLAAVRPLARNGAIYNVGSGEVITLRHLIETIARAVSPDALDLVRFGALPYRDTEVWEMCCDITAARRELGYAPRVALGEGVAATVAWYRAHPQA